MSSTEISHLLNEIDRLKADNVVLESQVAAKGMSKKHPRPSVKKTVCLKEPLEEGIPGPEHFTIKEEEVPTLSQAGDILVQVLAMSADPYLRGGIKPGRGKNAGDAMNGFVSGFVLETNSPDWVVGDLFGAALEFSNIMVVSEDTRKMTAMWKLTGLIDEKDISYGVGVMGMPGSTAYGGLIDVLKPKTGETIFISAAAGAVGGLVGQIAKNEYGCTVIGSCGGPEKGRIILDKYGFDAHIDYKKLNSKEELKARLKEEAPEGIDMYFENVGGMHFEASLESLKKFGRIAVCGCIANYNKKTTGDGNSPGGDVFNKIDIGALIYNFQRVEGFVCSPWLTGQKGNFLKDMSQWLKAGKIQVQETHHQGIDQWPVAFQSLFTGANKGKVVIML